MTVFHFNFGRLSLTWVHLLLTFAAGITQSFGIALFIPVLKFMSGSAIDLPRPFLIVQDMLTAIGLSFNLPVVLALIVVLSVVGLALNFAQYCLLQSYSQMRFVREMRAAVIEGMLDAEWHYSSKQTTGKTVNRMTEEVMRSGAALAHQVTVIATAVQMGVFLVISMMISWQLLLIALGFGVVIVVILRPLRLRAVKIGERLLAANDAMGYRTVDYLTNIKLVKVMSAERQIAGRINQLQKDVVDQIAAKHINLGTTHFVTQAFPVLLIALVILVAQDYLHVDPSHTLVILLLLARITPSMTKLQQAYQSYSIDLPALRGVDEFVAASRAHGEAHGNGNKPFTRLDGEISFENVTYRYPDTDKDALADVDLRIGRGQMVAIVGKSGGGKSTLVDLLCGLRRPTGGIIRVNGEDLRTFDVRSWRRCIGYVTQDVAVFNDTVRNNLLVTGREPTEAEIENCIRLAHFAEVVEELPESLETQLGEGGVRLSGGQKQRLALARALINSPQLFILDEATSALDNESERLIQGSIESISRTMTIVVIAHRLSTVRKADVIYVLEGGRVVESGNYASLLADNKRFAELHNLQFT